MATLAEQTLAIQEAMPHETPVTMERGLAMPVAEEVVVALPQPISDLLIVLDECADGYQRLVACLVIYSV